MTHWISPSIGSRSDELDWGPTDADDVSLLVASSAMQHSTNSIVMVVAFTTVQEVSQIG